MNLGLAIAPTGKIRDIDAQALLNFKKQVDREFADNLVLGANIQASDYRNKHAVFAPDKCLDEDSDTYWATTDSVQQATLEIDFQKPVTFNRLLLQEYIALGQRIHEFTLEAEENGEYRQIVNGTTVGYKRIVRFDAVKTSKARITLNRSSLLNLIQPGILPCAALGCRPYCSPRYSWEGTFQPRKRNFRFLRVKSRHTNRKLYQVFGARRFILRRKSIQLRQR